MTTTENTKTGATETNMGGAMTAAREAAKTAKAQPAKTKAQGNKSTRRPDDRPAYTMALAKALCPHEALATNLARTFALDPVDFEGIRETTREHMVSDANALTDALTDRPMQMHLQRIVGAFVSSACGAGQFYSRKVTEARDLTSKLAAEQRDEDRDGVYGFESRAARARTFAARAGLQAHALLAAAQGAGDAYALIIGEDWKPYEGTPMNPESISRRSAAAEISAFNT